MGAIGYISPALHYRDAHSAIEFLENAFGFQRRLVVPDDNMGVAHAELTWRDSVIMVGSTKPDLGWVSPLDLAGRVSQTLSIVVDDVEAHYQRAVAGGATITRELQEESYGGRGYQARDPEGHVWYFGSYLPGAWWEGKTP